MIGCDDHVTSRWLFQTRPTVVSWMAVYDVAMATRQAMQPAWLRVERSRSQCDEGVVAYVKMWFIQPCDCYLIPIIMHLTGQTVIRPKFTHVHDKMLSFDLTRLFLWLQRITPLSKSGLVQQLLPVVARRPSFVWLVCLNDSHSGFLSGFPHSLMYNSYIPEN